MSAIIELEQAAIKAREAQQELSRVAKAKGKEALREGANILFGRVGDELTGLGFSGYIPYFNDGEPCVFGLGECEWWLTGRDDPEEGLSSFRYVDGDTPGAMPLSGGRYYVEDALVADETPYREFDAWVQKLDDVWEEAFGSHFIVKVTRDDIEIEEYHDHD
jgi:hypothetical protein